MWSSASCGLNRFTIKKTESLSLLCSKNKYSREFWVKPVTTTGASSSSQMMRINGLNVSLTQMGRFGKEGEHVWWQLVQSCEVPFPNCWDLGVVVCLVLFARSPCIGQWSMAESHLFVWKLIFRYQLYKEGGQSVGEFLVNACLQYFKRT